MYTEEGKDVAIVTSVLRSNCIRTGMALLDLSGQLVLEYMLLLL